MKILEANILSAIGSTSAGESVIVDLCDGDRDCDGYSVQMVYDVQAPSAVVVPSASISTTLSKFTSVAHGLVNGMKVQIATSGALPTGLSAVTDYFVTVVSVDVFQLASSLAGALAGAFIVISDVGTGNQTVTGVALASCSALLQKSNDNIDWTDIQAATAITADGVTWYESVTPTYRYLKITKALTSGVCDLKAHVLVVG